MDMDSTNTPSGDGTPKTDTTAAVKANLPADQAVLEYLRSKGLYQAALELNTKLSQEKQSSTSKDKQGGSGSGSGSTGKDNDTNNDSSSTTTGVIRERLEQEEEQNRAQRSLMTRATGGGYGYERDDVMHVVKWGIPDTHNNNLTTTALATESKDPKMIGSVDAETFIDSFVALQLWVLTLPDYEGAQQVDDPVARAQAIMESKEQNASLESVIREVSKSPYTQPPSSSTSAAAYNLPPSAKPELLSVTFALLVYTYCELLEVGMDSVAHQLRDAFKSLYEPIYPDEIKDLFQCVNTDDMMRLNSYNNQHMETIAHLKAILVEVAKYQLRREEYRSQQSMSGSSEAEQKMREFDRNIGILKSKYSELSEKASRVFNKLHDWPFLRRARAARWHLSLSHQSYGLLTAFLSARDNSLLPMSSLLHTKCVIVVEQRDPLPFIPACVLLDKPDKSKVDLTPRPISAYNQEKIRWAAPSLNPEKKEPDEKLPFPKFNLEEEYDNEDEARRDKRIVEFNRALLTKGFRRLAALERKRTYESLTPAAQKRMREGEDTAVTLANPLVFPTILLTTLCASTSGPMLRPATANANSKTTNVMTDVTSIWEEPGIGLCCAKLCPPDGRRIAVGCDDSAVRIWHINDSNHSSEPSQVLLGHKNGFAVFGVDWNRDGRTLLSAGGDGSIRLWDTLAEGPFGELAKPLAKSSSSTGNKPSTAKETLASLKESMKEDTREPDMSVEGYKAQTSPYTSGAALAVYRGHVPATPVWDVAFSPAGYYFASAGGDGTARLWTTDRTTPVRLFTGHTANNVNCVAWHPNANYIITGSDDRTARLWDIQSGRTVRLLTGCSGGVSQVQISPGGRYAVAADQTGIVHMWDLSSGKKVSEFRAPTRGPTQPLEESSMIHSLAFSPCGTALAVGGDDATVRIWDVRRETLDKPNKAHTSPYQSFPTRQTMLLDLHYTSRNLLLGIGKFLTPIQLLPRPKN